MENNKGYTYQNESNLKKEGLYECFVDKIEQRTTQSGVDNISITLKIRGDVEQSYKNGLIFDTIWKEKDNKDFYDRKKINRILGTQKEIKEGTTFSSINEIISYLKGKTLSVQLGVRFSEYKGSDENYVKYYSSSKVVANTFTNNETIEVVEDELPF